MSEPAVSFEFFPPGDEAMAQQLWQSVQRLAPLRPSFVSVTYGADGSTRTRTHEFVQRVLREAGFTHVEVTGRSGDGGIDGRGIARIHGLMSFHVLFQCKRYKGAVGPGEIRDFRGAMVGRADKGLFITTGTFTPAAVKEATRDGAPPIDLLDGGEFAEKLKELKLGVRTESIEVVRIDADWFDSV